MRTRWSVLLMLNAACQTAGSGGSDAIVWQSPVRKPVPALKDAGGDGTRRPRRTDITVGDAVKEALTANRTVRRTRLAAAIALATEREARAGLLPSLILTGAYSRRDSTPRVVTPEVTFTTGPREVASYVLNLDFPIFSFGRYIHAYSAARFARRGAEADSAAAEADIAAAVTATAFDLLVTQRAAGVAADNEKALSRQVQDSQALLDAGRVTKSALLEAQVLHDRARREHEKLISLLPIKRLVLNQLLGRPADMATGIVDDPIKSAPDFRLPDLLAEAQRNRPELLAARMRVAAALRNHRSARGAALPELRGSLAYRGTDSDFVNPREYGTFGLSLNVPLYTGGANYARIRRAGREAEVAQVALRDLEQTIHTEVASAHRDVIEAYRDIAVADRSTGRSEENLRIQREKFTSGRATSQEVLESTALLTQSRFDYISALYRYNNALSALHRARGADPRRPPSTSAPTPGKQKKK